MILRRIASALAALSLAAGAAQAAPAAGLARIDELSSFAVANGICDRAGYRVNKEAFGDAVGQALDQIVAAGVARDAVDPLLGPALEREKGRFMADADAIGAALKKDPKTPGYRAAAQAAALTYADNVLARCERAVRDPVFGKVIMAPPGSMSLQDQRDGLMADYGQASFQPSEALAQGDLLYALGQCRSFLTAADIKRYEGDVLDGPDPTDPAKARLRGWYRGQFQDGLNRAGKFSREDCADILPNAFAEIAAHRGL